MIRILTICSLAMSAALAMQAQTPTAFFSFNGGSQGGGPYIFFQGPDGNFYGQDTLNPTFNRIATIFQITPAGNFTSIYQDLSGGNGPDSIVFGSDGNIYGITAQEGSCTIEPILGCGTVFKVTLQGVYSLIYTFNGVTDGVLPSAIVEGGDGAFYGVTVSGATFGGTIFQVTPSGSFTTVHKFSGPDGADPNTLTAGPNHILYGSTLFGGTNGISKCPVDGSDPAGCGTIFKIAGGLLTTLYSFAGGDDGSNPSLPLVVGKDGNLYGGTTGKGANGQGTIFQLTPSGTLTTLHAFDGSDGSNVNSLLQATDGNLYGTTSYGGTGACPENIYGQAGCGTLFEVSSAGDFTSLYSFPPASTGAAQIPAQLLQGADGNLYGITQNGGPRSFGTVFEWALASPNAPAISSANGVLNGASFQPGISPGSWITINGTNLSTKTDTWNNSIVKGALPTTLDGVSVMVGGQPAYVEYVSPTQINALAPDVPAGSVPVTVTNSNGTSSAATAQLSAEQPAFFQWGTYAVATRQDFSLAVKNGTFPGTTTVPAKPGDVIILWGTGLGPTSPSAPPGMQTPSNTTYNTATTVSVTVGGKPATVYGAALAPGYAGLYQVAIQIPAGLANGDYPLVATINGASSPSTTMITVHQ
jgi:uncharacterized protein (TIGR03437 family)